MTPKETTCQLRSISVSLQALALFTAAPASERHRGEKENGLRPDKPLPTEKGTKRLEIRCNSRPIKPSTNKIRVRFFLVLLDTYLEIFIVEKCDNEFVFS